MAQAGFEPRSTVLSHVATNVIGGMIIKSGISPARTDNRFYGKKCMCSALCAIIGSRSHITGLHNADTNEVMFA